MRHGFFGWFNRRFDWARDHYVTGVRGVIARSLRWFAIYAAVVAAVALLFVRLPTAFVPSEDHGRTLPRLQASIRHVSFATRD